MDKRRLAILGSTGSIGVQALSVVREHRELFDIQLLTAANNSLLLIQQAIEFNAACVPPDPSRSLKACSSSLP